MQIVSLHGVNQIYCLGQKMRKQISFGFVTCWHNVKDTRHGLGAQFVSAPTQQRSILALRLRLVAGNASTTAWLRGHAVDFERLDGGVVEGPTEQTRGRVSINVTEDTNLLVPGCAVHPLLTRTTHWFICKTNYLTSSSESVITAQLVTNPQVSLVSTRVCPEIYESCSNTYKPRFKSATS